MTRLPAGVASDASEPGQVGRWQATVEYFFQQRAGPSSAHIRNDARVADTGVKNHMLPTAFILLDDRVGSGVLDEQSRLCSP